MLTEAKIVRIWLNLFVNSLLPTTFTDSKNVLGIPPIMIQPPSQIINRDERTSGTGIFQSFTSYLSSYAADDPPEPSEEELSDTLCTIDCLHACPMEDIFANAMYVDEPS